MSHWNLPPGVSTNMLPGNRPEDAALETIGLSIDDAVVAAKSLEYTQAEFLSVVYEHIGKRWEELS